MKEGALPPAEVTAGLGGVKGSGRWHQVVRLLWGGGNLAASPTTAAAAPCATLGVGADSSVSP